MKTNAQLFSLIIFVLMSSTALTAQTLTSIDPNYAQQGESFGVGISGQDTHFDQATTMSIWLSQGSATISAYGYFPINDTFMTAWFDISIDAAEGLHDLNVYNEIDGTMTLSNSFIINPSDIVSVDPNTAQQDQILIVAITGQDTHFDYQQGSGTTVWFGQGSTTTVWGISDTLLLARFNIPEDATTGLQDISVYNDIDGMLTFDNSFTITPYNRNLTSITPDGAYQGHKLSVRITGQNTRFEQGSGAIAWLSQGNSRIFSKAATAIGGSEQGGSEQGVIMVADFDIPTDANAGMWDVHTFSEIDWQLTLTDGFMIVQPGDWTSDGVVNFLDLAVLANHWLEGTDP
jgi:hypothetical protein